MRQIVLASTSPRRKALLEQIGLKFRVAPSNIEEKMNPRLKPRGNAEYLSQEKAKAVAQRFKNAIIIAADTFVVLDDEIIEKPRDTNHAKVILRKLSGRSHVVVTGFTFIDTASGKTVTKSVETIVWFKKLSKKEIDDYVSTGEPMDKSGAYGMQDRGGIFITRVEGEYTSVIGLPLNTLYEELRKFGVNLF